MRISLLCAFFIASTLSVHTSYSQEVIPPKAMKIFLKAEHLYHHFAYYDAIEQYKRFLAVQKGHHESMLKIADSYYKVKDYDQTLAWYDTAVTTGDIPVEHEFQYADVLMNHGLSNQAIMWLKKYVESRPDDKRAREKLNGLEDIDQFYKDYRLYSVSNFPVNSAYSDFSPVYYKDGLIFVSSREDVKKKKDVDLRSYRAYLNLYYVAIHDSVVSAPEKMKGIDSKFHEGPLTVYDSGRKMIFTRSDFAKSKQASEESNTVHFQLFSTENVREGEWSTPKLLSIHDKQYSMGHPSVSEDGNVLYFASNLPGGRGGSDIYKSVWSNNAWGKPENLGADINTEGNEMFPHIVDDSVLYFSSDGFRSLGGLDIFKVNLNHPSDVHNVGYPINSSKDDFGFLLDTRTSEGYFSSNREGGVGNDDIYKFTIRTSPPADRHLAARVFRESDQVPLDYAKVKIISFAEPDVDVLADPEGVANFSLPEGMAFVIIGNKDAYTGMYSGTVEKGADKSKAIYPVPAATDFEKVLPVIGRITNSNGDALPGATITVTDKSTGEKAPFQYTDGMLSFYGQKGKEYTITVEDKAYESASIELRIPQQSTSIEKLSITLKNKSVLVAKVFKEADQSALAGAQVKIISFTEPDLELLADNEGKVNFSLPTGTAFVIIGSKDQYTGMYSGENTPDQVSEYPVPANTDHAKELPVVAQITNTKGETLPNASITVTEKSGEEKIPFQFNKGVLSFHARKGQDYTVAVEDPNYQPASTVVSIPTQTNATVEKISITLENKSTKPIVDQLVARVIKETDQSALAGAQVKIISFTEPDSEYTADDKGEVNFTLPNGTPFIAIGSKGKYTGMYSGETNTSSPTVYLVPAVTDHASELPVAGRITNGKGESLADAHVTVTENASKEKIPSQFVAGVLSFYGEKGKTYNLDVEHPDYMPASQPVSIPKKGTGIEKITVTLREKLSGPVVYAMAVKVAKESDKSPLGGASVRVISFAEPDLELTADNEGIVNFTLPEGAAYMVIGSKDEYTGMHSGMAEKGTDKTSVVHPVWASNDPARQLPILGLVIDETGTPVGQARVQVRDKDGLSVEAKVEHGIIYFYGRRNTSYSIEVTADGYDSQIQDIAIDANASLVKPLEFNLAIRKDKLLESSTLIVFNNIGNPRLYLTSDESHHQLVERDGVLYLENPVESQSIGKGTLADLQNDPVSFATARGLASDQVIKIDNIYFKYNRSTLDKTDKRELAKVKKVLHRYSFLKLAVSTHADSRGDATYNYKLSKRRGRSIQTNLTRQGIEQQRIGYEAYGEKALLVACPTGTCSEDDHRKNRRAEFDFGELLPTDIIFNKSKALAEKPKSKGTYADVLEKYGDKQVDGLVFKISVGAYRRNHTLTFSELEDMGTIEKKLVNGIMYYYLTGFETLRKAEEARQLVIQRGITDAYNAIFYNGSKISFSKFVSLTN